MPTTARLGAYIRLFLYLGLLGLTACITQTNLPERAADWFSQLFAEATPREEYASLAKRKRLVSPLTLEAWENVYQAALADSVYTTLPHREVIVLDSTLSTSAQSLAFTLPFGRRLSIRADEVAGSPIFADLYRPGDDRPVASWDTLDHFLDFENETGGPLPLRLVLQTLPGAPSRYDLRLLTTSVLEFPVVGKDEGAIQSFWGASRDGGRRSHKGNDIFAPKRTPLVACADGRVRVKNGGLGGKTIWLRDGEGRGVSYYYAHLDSQLVSTGQYVQRGDTIGLVGNTGNARTTPPHLHFGIYGRAGAFDPYPLLRRDDELPRAPQLLVATEAEEFRVPQRGNHYLRTSPDREDNVVRQLANGEAVTPLGSTGRYYRIRTAAGRTGYANFD